MGMENIYFRVDKFVRGALVMVKFDKERQNMKMEIIMKAVLKAMKDQGMEEWCANIRIKKMQINFMKGSGKMI